MRSADARRAPPILLLIGATMGAPLALNIFVPSMPSIVAALGTDFTTAQLTLTLYLAGIAVGQLIYGPLSDRFGRRPVLLAGMTLFLAASIAAAFAPTIGLLIAGRMVQALGGCAGMVLTRAILRDVYAKESAASALGYVTMAMAVAPAVAPAIGGQLDVWFGWRASFVVITVFAAALLAACAALLHESNRQPVAQLNGVTVILGYGRLLGSPVYLGYALSTALGAGAFYAFLGGAPYVVVELIGATPRDYGIYFIIVAGGYAAGSFLAGRLSTRVGVDGMILLGVGVSLFGAAALIAAAAGSPPGMLALFGPMCVIAIGNGVSQPNGVAGAISVNPQAAGAAAGLLGFLQMAGGGVLTFLVGWLLSDSQWPLVAVMAVSTTGSLSCFLLAVWSRRRHGMPHAVSIGEADRIG